MSSTSITYLTAGSSGFYEILLIVFVLILIFNGLLKRKVLSKINDNLDRDFIKKKDEPLNPKTLKVDGEYIEYEIIEDKKESI